MVTSNGSRISRTPYDTLFGVRRELDRMFEQVASAQDRGWDAPADVIETESEIRFMLEVPGIRPEDIEVTVENGVLTVAGEKQVVRREGETAEQYRLVERRYGRFTRSFRLPPTVSPDRVSATCENGLLSITLPRAEEAKPRRIQVQTGTQSAVESGESR